MFLNICSELYLTLEKFIWRWLTTGIYWNLFALPPHMEVTNCLINKAVPAILQCVLFFHSILKLLLHFVLQPRQETILLFFQLLAGSILYIVYKPFLVSVVSLFLQYLLLPPAAALPDTSAAQNRWASDYAVVGYSPFLQMGHLTGLIATGRPRVMFLNVEIQAPYIWGITNCSWN